MKEKRKFLSKTSISLIMLVIILLQFSFVFFTLADNKEVSGFSARERLGPDSSNTYEFENNLIFEISNNETLEFEMEYENQLQDKQISLSIENNWDTFLEIDSRSEMNRFGYSEEPQEIQRGRNRWRYRYNCIYRIQTNQSIEKLTFSFDQESEYGLESSQEYSVSLYNSEDDSWEIISTEDDDSDSESQISAELNNLEPGQEYFITIYEQEESTNYYWIIWVILIGIIALIALAIIISKKEYFEKLMKRTQYIEKGAHRLTMEEVLENENRNHIIDLILKEPGIHFNELLRRTGLAAGTLVWHLDILETYKVIGKKRVGKIMAYFPYYQKNPLSNLDLKLQKSKLTLEVLEMIEDEPGIWNGKITKKKKIGRKTIQYHIDKLADLGLIHFEKDGRKKKLYPNFESEYYQKKTNGSENGQIID